jgi:bla regulator protein blaR1
MIAAFLFNHLWQSTVFAVVAGLLTLGFRKNHARIRYWLWLTASVKFLIPFSLLVNAGNSLSWRSTPAERSFSTTVALVSQPFSVPAAAPSIGETAKPAPELLAATAFAGLWACGFVTLTLIWVRRWLRLRGEVRAASPLPLPGVTALSSASVREPGVFGIWRAVLVVPQGINEKLTTAEMRAIVAHELCHIQNRDNLSAALHMCVELIFWFHPLVWWIGSRLVEERERACDEEVLRRGNEPQIYAEGILKTCKLYLASPLTCVSGVSGSDLTKRVARIMTNRAIVTLGFGRKVLLMSAGAAALGGPLTLGLMNAAPPSNVQLPAENGPKFESVSIKPTPSDSAMPPGLFFIRPDGDRYRATNVTLKNLVSIAYGVQEAQISGGPSWFATERYNIEAKSADVSKMSDEERKLYQNRVQLMLRPLLQERFKLALHKESIETHLYSLEPVQGGAKLHKSGSSDPVPPELNLRNVGPNVPVVQFVQKEADLSQLADILSRELGQPVVDNTGLKGPFDYTLVWAPNHPPGGPATDPTQSTVFAALEEQLGLKVVPQKGPVEVLVVDHAEKATIDAARIIERSNGAANYVGPKVVQQIMPRADDLPPGVLTKPTLLRVKVHIDSLGHVTDSRLLSYDEVSPLASAVSMAAGKWKFEPATLGGRPVDSDHYIVFQLAPRDHEYAPVAVEPHPPGDYVGPKILLQIMPHTGDLPHGLITEPARVEVEVRINALGHVSAAHLTNFDPQSPLGSAVLTAAKQWIFQPATLHGEAVDSDHTIVFELRPDE